MRCFSVPPRFKRLLWKQSPFLCGGLVFPSQELLTGWIESNQINWARINSERPSFAYHNLGFTYLYCLQELWQRQVPRGCRQGQKPLPPKYPVTWWLRVFALCYSCPARTSRPLVAGDYLQCPRWPVSIWKTNKQKQRYLSNSGIISKKELICKHEQWHADTQMKWMTHHICGD